MLDLLALHEQQQQTQLDSEDSALHHTVTRSGASYPKPPVPTPSEHKMPGDTAADADPQRHVFQFLQDDPKDPKFKGDDAGSDVHTFLAKIDATIVKYRLTTDAEKLALLTGRVDPSPCAARRLINSDFFSTCTSFDDARKRFQSFFAAAGRQGPLSSLFNIALHSRPLFTKKELIPECLESVTPPFTDIRMQFKGSKWVDANNKMDLDDVARLFTYLLFLQRCTDFTFSKLQEIPPLEPKESILDHATKIKGAEPLNAAAVSSTVRAVSVGQNRPTGRSQSRGRQPWGRSNTPRGRSPTPRGRPRFHSVLQHLPPQGTSHKQLLV